ncbi:hypothetical protein V8B97DRAFT_881604 [Scleroderma yunnanense]
MGMKYRRYLAGERIYGCSKCKTHLATIHSMISRAFNGQHGRAYLFEGVVNVVEGEPNDRLMTTGNHTVRDIYCVKCATQSHHLAHHHPTIFTLAKYLTTIHSRTCLHIGGRGTPWDTPGDSCGILFQLGRHSPRIPTSKSSSQFVSFSHRCSTHQPSNGHFYCDILSSDILMERRFPSFLLYFPFPDCFFAFHFQPRTPCSFSDHLSLTLFLCESSPRAKGDQHRLSICILGIADVFIY